MPKFEYSIDAPEKSRFVRCLQVIAGTVLMLGVSTIAYVMLFAFAGYIPGFIWNRFDFIGPVTIQVIITAAIGMWLGAVSLKLAFPDVKRRWVFAIIGPLMVLAVIGGVIGGHWEALISSVVFLIFSGICLLDEKSWETLPGRKAK